MTEHRRPSARRRISRRRPSSNGASWSTACSRARPSSGWSPGPMTAFPSSRSTARARRRSPGRRTAARRALADHGADRSSRSGRRQREALHELENGATACRWFSPARSAPMASGLTPRRDGVARVLDGVDLDAGVAARARSLAAGQDAVSADRRAGRSGAASSPAATEHPHRPRSDRRHGANGGKRVVPVDCEAPHFAAAIGALARDGFRGPFAPPTDASSTMPAARRRRNWPSCSPSPLAYLRALEAGGVALDAARRMIFFRLAADADQFLTIAKFRALRKLWARVERRAGLRRRRLSSRPRPRGA